MQGRRSPLFGIVCLSAALTSAGAPLAAEDPDADLVQLVVDLLGDQDKDVRALGLEQVRSAAQGPAATRRFAALLPHLPPEVQVGLLRSLADRGDAVARPAVLDVLATAAEETVRVAAIGALGFLGEPADSRRMVEHLSDGSQAEHAAARASLVRLPGESVPRAIAAEMKDATGSARVALFEILAQRRAFDTVSDILPAATDADPAVRAAAMIALGQMASPEHLAGLVQGVLRAKEGTERAAAERAVATVCGRIPDAEERAAPLLAVLDLLESSDQRALLPALGRVGGLAARDRLAAALADGDAGWHEAGLRGLCNWPDASIAPQLIELATGDEHPDHRTLALRALIRVAPLPDGRPDDQRLALLRQTLALCGQDEERNLVLERAHAIRTVETLRFLTPFLDQPAYAQEACQSVVELAHHRGLREPNKAEFDQALDKVIATSMDATVIDRAQRYKKGQIWVRRAAPKRP